MIIALVITIILTISFTSRTDTQITQLEDEGQKAVNAAEAGIESTLKNNTAIGDLKTLGNLGSSIATGSTTLSALSTNKFTSPKLVSGQAFNAFLGAYTAGSPPTYAPSTANILNICFEGATPPPSLDISLLKNPASSPVVRRYLADPGNNFGGSNKMTVTAGCAADSASSPFSYSVSIPGSEIGTDSTLLVIRVMFASTKIFISQTGLPAQGTTVTSQATSKTGVTKKLQLFQSYPQIPVEFFFTTF